MLSGVIHLSVVFSSDLPCVITFRGRVIRLGSDLAQLSLLCPKLS